MPVLWLKHEPHVGSPRDRRTGKKGTVSLRSQRDLNDHSAFQFNNHGVGPFACCWVRVTFQDLSPRWDISKYDLVIGVDVS